MANTDFEIVEPEIPVELNNTYEVLNRTVVEAMTNVKLVDSDNGLDYFCYTKCGPLDTENTKRCRGIGYNGDKLITSCFPYTYEYTKNDIPDNILDKDFNKLLFYDAYEGSIIRMFYFGDKWYTSTNRKLDANKSKWSSKESFGHFFNEALNSEIEHNEKLRDSLSVLEGKTNLERFQDTLDKDKQYMFLLLNNDQNRIVCLPPTRPTFYHVGTFIKGELTMDEDINIPYPKKHNFTNVNDIFDYIEDIDFNKLQGIIIFAPGNTQYKIFNSNYYDYYRVRGNEPSIKFRYLQVRMDKRYNNLMHCLYPSFSSAFEEYENNIYNISKQIHKAYFDRFIKNEYVKVPPEEFNVIKECHNWHLEDRVNNKINLNKVIEVLNAQQPTNINKMIRRLYADKKEKQDDKTHEVKTKNFIKRKKKEE